MNISLSTFFKLIHNIEWKDLAVCSSYCPLCHGKRLIIRLHKSDIGVRCLHCRATAVTMSLVAVLQEMSPDLHTQEVYELSSRGPLVRYLKQSCRRLLCSEYYDDTAPGEVKNGVLCQDVQHLTFSENSFDICSSTEVFEHVPDDRKGFAEIFRVLRPGGLLIFTVPLSDNRRTIDRAVLVNEDTVEYLHPPQYHSDTIRGTGEVLVYRDYGLDIVDRLVEVGFCSVELLKAKRSLPWEYNSWVITARVPRKTVSL